MNFGLTGIRTGISARPQFKAEPPTGWALVEALEAVNKRADYYAGAMNDLHVQHIDGKHVEGLMHHLTQSFIALIKQ